MAAFCASAADLSLDFEQLVPADKTRERLEKKGWEMDQPLMLPKGWMMMEHRSKGICHLETQQPASGKNSLFLKGDLMIVPALSKCNPEKHGTCTFTIKAKRRPGLNGTGYFHLMLYGEKNAFLGTKSASFAPGNSWTKISREMQIPATSQGKKVVQVAPGFGSDIGLLFDDLEITFNEKLEKVPPTKASVQPAMDFDFKGCQGKMEFQDSTGKYKLVSECGEIQEEASSLRSSFGARLKIDMSNDALGDADAFTITTWMLRSSINGPYRAPLVERGYRLNWSAGPGETPRLYDFSIEFNASVPEFKTAFGGLISVGNYYAGNFRYQKPEWVKHDPKNILPKDAFMHFAAVYDKGTTRTYINGIPVGERIEKAPRKLLTSGRPLYIGGARVEGEEDNLFSSDMLLRTFRVYPAALSEAEISWDCDQVPAGLKPGEVHNLTPIKAYYSPIMKQEDPEFKKRMPITEQYLSKKQPPADWETLNVELRGDPRALSLYANGKLLPQVAWQSNPDSKNAEINRDMAAAGARIYRVGNVIPDRFWLDENTIDLQRYYFKYFDNILEADPDALFFVVIPVAQSNWWLKKYPEELEQYLLDRNHPELGKKPVKTFGGPFSSDKWLELSTNMVSRFVKEMEASKYARHILSYHVTSGDSAEWYWPGTFSGLPGYSIRTVESFRKFLREKYKGDEAALRTAWKDAKVTFDTVEVPTNIERTAAENGFFRDYPKVGTKTLDFRHYLNYRTKLGFDMICGAARKAAPKGRLITTYFGYSLFYAGRQSILHTGGQQFVAEAMRSPYIDGICTPIDYLFRRGGEPGINIAGYSGSGLLYNKMVWREDDLRTHFHTRLEWGRTATPEETSEVIHRSVGYTLADMYGAWFMALEAKHGFHQQCVLEQIALDNKALAQADKERRDVSEVALILDEKDSIYALAWLQDYFGRFVVNHVWGTYQAAHSAGAPFKVHLLEDLEDTNMPDYKLYVFLNAWSITDKQRQVIQAKLAKNNAWALWQYAPGYMNALSVNIDNMKALSGFSFKEKREGETVRKYEVKPMLAVQPEDGVTIEYAGKSPVFAQKGRMMWSLLPPNNKLLARVYGIAGIHRYAEPGDLLLANDSYVEFHPFKPGDKTIKLPRKRKVSNPYDNTNYGYTDTITLRNLPTGKNILLKLE